MEEITALPESYSIIFSAEDKDIQDCIIYLQMKDERKSLDEIGAHFGYKSRQGMAKRRDKWIADGIMEKARRRFYIPKGEEINAAISRVMDDVPLMLDRMVKIVKLGREKNAIEAFKLLNDVIIQPERTKQPIESTAEQDYAARSAHGLPNPMVVSIPDVVAQESDQEIDLLTPLSLSTVQLMSELDDQNSSLSVAIQPEDQSLETGRGK